jgi:hypothetical protein
MSWRYWTTDHLYPQRLTWNYPIVSYLIEMSVSYETDSRYAVCGLLVFDFYLHLPNYLLTPTHSLPHIRENTPSGQI